MELNIEELLYAVRHNLKIVILTTLIIIGIFCAICFCFIPSKYEVSTKLLLDRNRLNDTYDYNEMQVNQSMLKTYKEIIESNDFIDSAMEDTDIEISAEEIMRSLTVKPQDDTQIMIINYKHTDVESAKKIMEGIQDEFLMYMEKNFKNSRVEVIDNLSVSNGPVSPNHGVWVMAGIMAGIFAGTSIAYAIEIKKNRFKSKKSMEEKLNLPVIAILTHKRKGEV